MPTKRLPPLQSGDELPADWLNQLADLVYRSRVVVDPTSGLEMREGPTGTAIRIAGQKQAFVARTKSGGIPAATGRTGATGMTPGSAVCDIYRDDGMNLIDTGRDEPVRNIGKAIAANTYIQVKRIDGFLHIDVEPCP